MSCLLLELSPLLDEVLQVDRIFDQLSLPDILLDYQLMLELSELVQLLMILLVLMLL